MTQPVKSPSGQGRKFPEPIIADRVVDGPMRSTYSRSVILLLAGSIALMMTGFGIVMPVFARRLGELGGGVEALGWMTMAFSGAQFVAAPFMGSLADRVGRRPLILLALAAFTAANIGYLLAPTVTIFILIRAVVGALTAGLSPAAMSIVADTVPERERGRWIGILMGGYGLGLIFGPVIGGILYDAWGFDAPFLTSAGMGVLALIAAIIVVPETRTPAVRLREMLYQRRTETTLPQASAQGDSLTTWLPRPLTILGALLLVDFIGTFSFTFMEPQMVFYVYDQLNWTTVQFGLVVAAYGVSMFIGQTLLGQLSDRFGRRAIIVLGIVLNSTLYAGLATITTFSVVMVVAAIAGLGSALIAPALSAFLLDITDAQHRSRMMGIKSSTLSLGGVLGPFLVVFVSRVTSPQGVFIIAGGLVLISGLLALLLLREPSTIQRTQEAKAFGQDPRRVATAHAVLHGLVVQAIDVRMQNT
ncbi:MFS transporter [Chloroflexi bacterium TSY]|nr:MFS transporter [Chloroflexi bacterium TSY]